MNFYEPLIASQADSLLDVTDALHTSPSRTSLNSVEAYREFERAEPVELTPSPGVRRASVEREKIPHRMTAIPMSDVLTPDMQNALIGVYDRGISIHVVMPWTD